MQILAVGAATFKIFCKKENVRSVVTPRYSGIEIKPTLLPKLVLDCHRKPCRLHKKTAISHIVLFSVVLHALVYSAEYLATSCIAALAVCCFSIPLISSTILTLTKLR